MRHPFRGLWIYWLLVRFIARPFAYWSAWLRIREADIRPPRPEEGEVVLHEDDGYGNRSRLTLRIDDNLAWIRAMNWPESKDTAIGMTREYQRRHDADVLLVGDDLREVIFKLLDAYARDLARDSRDRDELDGFCDDLAATVEEWRPPTGERPPHLRVLMGAK